MPKKSKPKVGDIAWRDLTVKNAVEVRDFCSALVGRNPAGPAVGGYDDCCMNRPGDGETVAGICQARGENTGLPAQWLIHINVANLQQRLAACRKNGGKVIRPARALGGGRITVIRAPAGAVAALFEPG